MHLKLHEDAQKMATAIDDLATSVTNVSNRLDANQKTMDSHGSMLKAILKHLNIPNPSGLDNCSTGSGSETPLTQQLE